MFDNLGLGLGPSLHTPCQAVPPCPPACWFCWRRVLGTTWPPRGRPSGSLPCLGHCRPESMTVNNFFSSVDGQLELLAQGALDSTVSSTGTLHALRPRLGRFHQLLLEPLQVGHYSPGEVGWQERWPSSGAEHLLVQQLEPLQMTWGSLAPPLGNTRLHVVKLLASALNANDAALTQELLVLDVPNTMLVWKMGCGAQGVDGGSCVSLVPACASSPGPLLPLCLQQLPACASGGVCEHHAELGAPSQQQL